MAVVIVALVSSCSGLTCNSTQTDTCPAMTCSGPAIPLCGDACIVPLGEGAACDPGTPCADTCHPGGPGQAPLSCQPNKNGDGSSCQAAVGLGAPCSATGGTPCASGFYCHNTALPQCAPEAPTPQVCAIPSDLDQPCDSDFATYNPETDCSPCAPGFTCGSGTQNSNGSVTRVCVKNCDGQDTDCPCGGVCGGGDGKRTTCFNCVNTTQTACDDVNRCCGVGTKCAFGACCFPLGVSGCTEDADCCGPSGNVRSLGCTNGVCAEEYPDESWTLCGTGCVTGDNPSDKVTHTISGTSTFAWGGIGQLSPVFTTDTDFGSRQALDWNPGWINQELIAFNQYYAGDMPNCAAQGIEVFQGMSQCASPTNAFFPSIDNPVMFSSLFGANNTTVPNPLTKPLVSFTGHVVFYDHGTCRIGIPWNKSTTGPGGMGGAGPLFDTISQAIVDGLACIVPKCPGVDELYSATRDSDAFQPQFASQLGDILHGFEFQAMYGVHLRGFGIFQDFTSISVNPAYSFGVDPATGLLAVTPINQGLVSVVNDTPSNTFHSAMVTALTQTVPQTISSTITTAFTIVPGIAGGPIPVLCDHTAPLSAQQSTCFGQYTQTSATQKQSTLFQILELAFIGQGQSNADAAAHAQLGATVADPRNFVCAAAGTTPAGVTSPLTQDTCAIHPVALRVNALPDEFEFVLAETFQDEARVQLYSGFVPELCGQKVTRCASPDEGCTVPLVQHGPLSESTPSSANPTCGACP